MTKELAKVGPAELAVHPESPGIDALLAAAVHNNVDLDKLERLIALKERTEDRNEESAFNAAFSEFKRTCPKIVRRTEDEYIKVSRGGVRRSRMYATTEDIAAVVDGPLLAVGLGYTWSGAVTSEDGYLSLSFLLSKGNHTKETPAPPVPIEGSEAYRKLAPNRNPSSASPAQCVAVAHHYARRLSMIAGLGLTTVDEDTDGRSIESGGTITKEQLVELKKQINLSDTDEHKFRSHFHIEHLADLPADRFEQAMAMMDNKMRQAAEKKAKGGDA